MTHVRIIIDLDVEPDGVSGQPARLGMIAAKAVSQDQFALDAEVKVEAGDTSDALVEVHASHLKLR